MTHLRNNLTTYFTAVTGGLMEAIRNFDFYPVIIGTIVAAIIGFSLQTLFTVIHKRYVSKWVKWFKLEK